MRFFILVLLAGSWAFAQGEAKNPFVMNGFHLLAWTPEGYAQAQAGQSLRDIAATGANWVVITPFKFMADKNASVISWKNDAAGDDALRGIIRQAKALGLKIALKPHVDSRDGTFRGFIDPMDTTAWFVSYSSMIFHYAALAEQSGADAYVVGTELMSMTKPLFAGYWQQIIRQTRRIYHGHLTYAAFMLEFGGISFWPELDSIGVDAYFPMGKPGSSATAGQMTKIWRTVYIPALRVLARINGKPILFSEIGISSQEGAHVMPWVYRRIGKINLEVQADYFAAFFDAFDGQDSWFLGFWQWGWTVDPNDGGPNDHTHAIEGKPALEVLKREFTKKSD